MQLSRDLDCYDKTAFVLAHKLREAMALEVRTCEVLTGHVETDGTYFGGTIRPDTTKVDREDRRLREHQNGQRRAVAVLLARLGRTLPVVTMAEAEGVALVHASVDRMAILSAVEASHWDMLHAGWQVDRVNHSETCSDHGKHTNWTESLFLRLRRMVQGQHHHVSPRYLPQYATQAAWLEDRRRKSIGALAFCLVANAMGCPVSRAWKGYCQRAAWHIL